MANSDLELKHILNQATARLPGVSQANLQHELFDVLREFFFVSSAWLEDISVPILPNTVSYDIVPSAGGEIIRLAGVVDVHGIPQPAIMATLGTLLFRNPYSQAATFTATVIESVVIPVNRDFFPMMPDWVFPSFGIGILDGLLGKMMQQVSKPYANARQSIYHLSRFQEAISRARVATLRRNTFGVQAWIYPQSYRTISQRGGVSVGSDQRFR